MVRAEVGIECDAQEAALAARVGRELQGRPGRAVAVDELDVARLLEHEEPAVG